MPNRDGTGPRGKGKKNRRQAGNCQKESGAVRSNVGSKKNNSAANQSSLMRNGRTVLNILTALWGLAGAAVTAFNQVRRLPANKAPKRGIAEHPLREIEKTESSPKRLDHP